MSINCKYCQSENVIKFGTYNDIQRYYCKSCNRKFTELDTLPKMKTPINEIAAAVNMFYGGMPIDGIQEQIQQDYCHYISEPTIYEWITRFTKEAISKSKDFKPKVGKIWLADETVLNVGNKKVWFWDIIDSDSRYLLASHVSQTRLTEDAQILVEKAITRAGVIPEVIITDKLRAYIDGIELASEGKTTHIRSKPFTDKDLSTNKIERFHGVLKQRTNAMHHFKDLNTTQLLTDGWLIHYNHFKDNDILNSLSPVENMGIDKPFSNWNDIVRNADVNQPATYVVYQSIPFHVPTTERQRKSAYARKAVRKSVAKRRTMPTMPQISTFRVRKGL